MNRGAGPVATSLVGYIAGLKEQIVGEAAAAVGMLETAVEALFALDAERAAWVVSRDDEVDREEVRIEEECFRLLALFQPVARDFRTIATLLRVNADLERVGDHATSIAKQTLKLRELGAVRWPISLQELGQRVPIQCHQLLRALAEESVDAARSVMMRDRAIDSLDRRLFEESVDMMSDSRQSKCVGVRVYRCGRELERVGDLMTSIAEDVIYLASGAIVRHDEKKRLKQQAIDQRM